MDPVICIRAGKAAVGKRVGREAAGGVWICTDGACQTPPLVLPPYPFLPLGFLPAPAQTVNQNLSLTHINGEKAEKEHYK